MADDGKANQDTITEDSLQKETGNETEEKKTEYLARNDDENEDKEGTEKPSSLENPLVPPTEGAEKDPKPSSADEGPTKQTEEKESEANKETTEDTSNKSTNEDSVSNKPQDTEPPPPGTEGEEQVNPSPEEPKTENLSENTSQLANKETPSNAPPTTPPPNDINEAPPSSTPPPNNIDEVPPTTPPPNDIDEASPTTPPPNNMPQAPPPTADKVPPTTPPPNDTSQAPPLAAPPDSNETRALELPLEKINNEEEEEESLVQSAKPGQTFETPPSPTQPLSLVWSYGFNHNVPVHNISTDDKKMIFYTCSHTGIIYDCLGHRQFLLQGHGHPITCTAVSGDRRWLTTADVGTDPLLIVWDSYSGIPVRTFYHLGQGIVGVAMSQDARYLATIGCQVPQVVSVWEWTNEREEPVHSVTLSPDHGIQTCITFSHNDSSLLASNSDDQVIFYKWSSDGLTVSTTPVSDRDFNKPVGLLSQTVFLPDGSNHWALTGTSEGCVVIWETAGLYHNQEMRPVSELSLERKKPVRLMKLHDSPVTAITTINQCIVTGDSVGHVKFFDKNLKLLHWYNGLCHSPIASISFAYSAKLLNSTLTSIGGYPSQSTLTDGIKFIIPDITLSTSTSSVIHLTTNGKITDVILEDHYSAVSALSTHPSQPLILVGSYSKKLKLWNYHKKEVIMSRQLPDQLQVECISYDPKGDCVGVGFTGGQVLVIDSVTLHDVSEVFHYSKDSVTLLKFSGDSHYMATADLDHTVTVFVSNVTSKRKNWSFLARHRSHYKRIEALLFGVYPDSGASRLLSLGRDRKLVEYDLANSSEDDLRLLSIDRIEQSATPTAISWNPPLSVESFLLTANDEYKLKLYNSTTKMCRKTLLGPTFGSPIRKILVLPTTNDDTENELAIDERRYLVYITDDKVGLLILPHDGNPYNSVCLTAHPEMISDVAVSYDGSSVFTAGGGDCVVNQWNINTSSLEAHSLLGGEGLEPFYSLIEGGRDGEFFAQLEEYFYYAQLRTQGTECMSSRTATASININQIPFVMRAIGYYPSEHEIDNMLNEVKFSQYVDKGGIVTDIDLGQFIQLYINHRPVFGLLPAEIAQSFKTLGKRRGKDKNSTIERTKLLRLLQEKGEHLTESELVDYLVTLVGSDSFLNPETDSNLSINPVELLQRVPQYVTAKHFMEEMLGLSTTP